jgi:bacteriorhodopsin
MMTMMMAMTMTMTTVISLSDLQKFTWYSICISAHIHALTALSTRRSLLHPMNMRFGGLLL